MPRARRDRYMSAQIDDLYTNIVGYVSPRTYGRRRRRVPRARTGGRRTTAGVDGVFDCPTDLALVLIRTQLFDDDDLAAVERRCRTR